MVSWHSFKWPFAPETEDDLEKFQKEVLEAELEVEASKDKAGDGELNKEHGFDDPDERPASPPDGVEEFTDDDGTIYKWDRTLRAMVPQVSVAFPSLRFIDYHHRMKNSVDLCYSGFYVTYP